MAEGLAAAARVTAAARVKAAARAMVVVVTVVVTVAAAAARAMVVVVMVTVAAAAAAVNPLSLIRIPSCPSSNSGSRSDQHSGRLYYRSLLISLYIHNRSMTKYRIHHCRVLKYRFLHYRFRSQTGIPCLLTLQR